MKKLTKIICTLLLALTIAAPHHIHAQVGALPGLLVPVCKLLRMQSDNEISACVANIQYFFLGVGLLVLAYGIYRHNQAQANKHNKHKQA